MRRLRTGLFTCALLAGLEAPAPAQETTSPASCWTGRLQAGNVPLRAVLEVAPEAAGANGLLHILAGKISTDSITDWREQGDSVFFTIQGEKLTKFAGLRTDSTHLKGMVERTGLRYALELERTDRHTAVETRALGTFEGTLNAGIDLKLVFKLETAPCGLLTGKMDSPSQGSTDLPLTDAAASGDSLYVGLSYINGSFRGTVSEDGDTITGIWHQAGRDFPELVLTRIDSTPGYTRPQDPVPPFPYDEEDVEYPNDAAGITLAGTLTLPRTGAPHPVVILISGSGAQDRNETLMGHRPFLVIADYLTRRGMAVLRYDDRGVGGSGGNTLQATLQDVATDVAAAIRFLKNRKDIDTTRIGLIGHSEGGWVAPIVASSSPDVAFIVMLAGPGVSGEDILYSQQEAILRATGVGEDVIKLNRIVNGAIFEVIKSEPDNKRARSRIDSALVALKEQFKGKQRIVYDSIFDQLNSDAAEQNLSLTLTPWFRYLLQYDPRPVLEKVKIPVLALNGEKDLQVLPDLNLKAVGQALTKGGNTHHKEVKLPGLNHLFQTANRGTLDEYGSIEETFSPAALKLIGDWIEEVTGGAQ